MKRVCGLMSLRTFSLCLFAKYSTLLCSVQELWQTRLLNFGSRIWQSPFLLPWFLLLSLLNFTCPLQWKYFCFFDIVDKHYVLYIINWYSILKYSFCPDLNSVFFRSAPEISASSHSSPLLLETENNLQFERNMLPTQIPAILP